MILQGIPNLILPILCNSFIFLREQVKTIAKCTNSTLLQRHSLIFLYMS